MDGFRKGRDARTRTQCFVTALAGPSVILSIAVGSSPYTNLILLIATSTIRSSTIP